MNSSSQRLTTAQQELEILVQATIVDAACRIERGHEVLTLVVPERVLFLTEENELTPIGFLLAHQLGTLLMIAPYDEIRVAGPIDWAGISGSSPGQFAQKLVLSKAQATALVRQLEENGLEAAKLSAEWYGHIRLIVSSEPHVNGQNNHRLEIILES
jgi:flagellar motor protein MotB